jgi:cytochrome b561
MKTSPITKYDSIAMLLHWLTAFLMIYMLFLGEDLIRNKDETSAFGPSLHVTMGVAILLLAVLRLIWRVQHPQPPFPLTMKPLEIKLSKATHHLFYALLVILPLTGWLAFPTVAAKRAYIASAKVFGAPMILAPDTGMLTGDIHAILSKVAIALLILHVLAALKHQFVDRDGILGRMLPW